LGNHASKLGVAIAAMIEIIAITIDTSIIVKPLLSLG
jgi:hypothetical protein